MFRQKKDGTSIDQKGRIIKAKLYDSRSYLARFGEVGGAIPDGETRPSLHNGLYVSQTLREPGLRQNSNGTITDSRGEVYGADPHEGFETMGFSKVGHQHAVEGKPFNGGIHWRDDGETTDEDLMNSGAEETEFF